MREAPTQPCSRHLQPTFVSSFPSHHLAPNHPNPEAYALHLPALQLNHFLPTPLTSLLPFSSLLQHQPPRSLSLILIEARSVSVPACLLSRLLSCLFSSMPSLSFLPGFCFHCSRPGITLKIPLSLESVQLTTEAKPVQPHPHFLSE